MKGGLLILVLLAVEVTNLRLRLNVRCKRLIPAWRLAAFAVLLWLIAFFGSFGANAFIYFQF